MQRFLEICASYIYRKYGDNLSDLTIVTPNRRSGLFFSAYLRKQISHAVIGPEIVPINEWIYSFSELFPADRLALISGLYEVYRKETGTTESFDDFYFWGEVLLSDFDDIDKYLVSAGDLFQNLLNLKEMELSFDYLTEEQKEVILQFWGSLKSWERFEHEKEFLFIWEKLETVYSGFREKLKTVGQGYAGMIMQDGVNNLETGKFPFPRKRYVIIGMNALNGCEKKVFSLLRESGKGCFLWDYDEYYRSNPVNTAGKFIRENLELYPPPADFTLQTENFSRKKNIELVAFPSLTGQSQIIPGILKNSGNGGPVNFDHTAIVLADESLLFHVLGAIPAEACPVNVTMGYPLRNSPVVSLLQLVSVLIRNTPSGSRPEGFWFKPVMDILSHQLLRDIERENVNNAVREFRVQNRIYIPAEMLFFSELHRKIFTLPVSTADFPAYFLEILRILYRETHDQSGNRILKETIYATYVALEKLQMVVKDYRSTGVEDLSPAVFFRLMMQYLNQVSVPFEGEPLSGIQVMGILETRCLDFENLIIIGLNEDVWPKADTAPSMIPFNLRKGFGLPGIDDQDAMYAYYFYRLVQRAEKITATWNTIREAISGGELSRLGFQLELHSPHKVIRKNFDYPLLKKGWSPVSVPSSRSVADRLLEYNQSRKALSPSAILTFLQCRLRFYFSYVVGLKEEEEMKEEIDRMIFGNIFHKAMESLYLPYVGKEMQVGDFAHLLSSPGKIGKAVMEAFTHEFYKGYKGREDNLPLEGKALLIKSTVTAYIRHLLEFDRERAPMVILSLEQSYETTISVEIDGWVRDIRIGGKSDRVDEKDDVIRIVDYKTGSMKNEDLRFPAFDQLFDMTRKEIKKESIQSLIYAWIVHRQLPGGKPVKAAVYSILNLRKGSGEPEVLMSKEPVFMPDSSESLEYYLKEILREMYSESTVFSQTEFTERCSYCPFSDICQIG